MKKLNNQTNQIIIAAVLLVIIGVANYINYYAPPKPTEKILSFSSLSEKDKEKLIESEKNEKKKHEKLSHNDEDLHEIKYEKTDDNINFKTSENNLHNSGNNYLNNAIDSNGKIVKWNKSKITVYVADSEYSNVIYKAMSLYNETFGDYFKFFIAKDRENSDVTVDVVDHFNSNDNKDAIYMAGVTNNNFTGDDKHLISSNIKILSIKPNSNRKMTNEEVFGVILHELGHAVGIIGHSQNSKDVMYPASKVKKFSDRDIATIKLMYSNDDELIKKETKNFADVKLREAEQYAKASPNKAISWINLGQVYYNLGKKDEALNSYKKALTIEPQNPMIYSSMAECYYTSNKFDTAIKYYNKAINYIHKNEEKHQIYNMIGLCYSKLDNFNSAYDNFKLALSIDPNNRRYLKNYLIACVETDKKREALNAINQYKEKFPSIENDEYIKEILKWAK